MIRLNVLPLLEAQGKTKYWLYKQLGMSYQNFKNMVDNKTKSIRYERIETLCLLLHCTPNELFEIDFSKEENKKKKARKRQPRFPGLVFSFLFSHDPSSRPADWLAEMAQPVPSDGMVIFILT